MLPTIRERAALTKSALSNEELLQIFNRTACVPLSGEALSERTGTNG
jgi:hypothetical protein